MYIYVGMGTIIHVVIHGVHPIQLFILYVYVCKYVSMYVCMYAYLFLLGLYIGIRHTYTCIYGYLM